MDERDIDRLVKRAVRGDAEAFGRLFDIYGDRVYAFALARVRDHHDAEDLTEIVFMKAYEAISSYDRRGLPFGAWLFRIARNTVIDRARHVARVPEFAEYAEAEALAGDESTDEEVLRKAGATRIRECVSALEEAQAACVALRFFWGLDVAETARAMDKTPGAIKALQHRAIRNLARMLREEYEDDRA